MSSSKLPEALRLSKGDPLPDRETILELAKPFPEFKLPHVPVFVDDFLSDTLDLSPEEVGAYLLILLALWRRDCKPIPREKLHRVCRVTIGRFKKHIWPELRRHFREGESGVWNNRLEEEWRESAVFSLKKRYLGSDGGSAKSLNYINGVPSAATSAATSPPPYTRGSTDVLPLGTVHDTKRRAAKAALPEDFVPDMDQARNLMSELSITRAEMNYCYQRMKEHAYATDRRQANWNRTFAAWVRKAAHDREIGPASRARKADGRRSSIDDA